MRAVNRPHSQPLPTARYTLADQALYLAKARGRNRVEVAPLEVSLGNAVPQPSMIHAPEQSAA